METYEPRDWYTRETVAAIFDQNDNALAAVRELKERGFTDSEIGVVARDRSEAGELLGEVGNQAGTGAATGAVSGGILGAALGLLMGVGALAIPGIGPVVAAGALAAWFGVAGGTAIAGAGIGALAGGVIGGLIGLGIPRHEAEYFEESFRAGGILITVTAKGRAHQAADILEANGGDTGSSLYSTTSAKIY